MIRVAAAGALLCLAAFQSAGQVAPAKRLSDLKYPPFPAVKALQPERFELSNGMTVFLLEDHDLPTITAGARIRSGGRLEQMNRAGLAAITGKTIRSGGTITLTAAELDAQLDRIGAKVETDISEASGIALMYALKEDAAKVLHLFADVLRNPAFPQAKIDLAKREIANGLLRADDNEDRLSRREMSILIYGGNSAYSHSPNIDSLKAISRADVVEFHKRYFQPENVVVGIWGDFERDRMLALVEKELGSWPRGGQPRPELPLVDPGVSVANRGVFLLHRPGAANAIVTVGTLAGKRNDPNFYAGLVLSRILSGRMISRIRSQKGLAYNVYALWAAQFDYPGICLIRSDAKRDDAMKVVEIVNEQLHIVSKGEVRDEEIQHAKDSILKGTAFDFDTVDKVVTRFVDYEYFGYSSKYIQNFRENVSKVAKSDLLRVAKEFWDPAKMTLLVVGDVAGLEKSLSAYGPVKFLNAP